MAHMRPLENSEIPDEEIKARFRHYEQTRGFTPNSIRTMARRPDIVKHFRRSIRRCFMKEPCRSSSRC